MDLARLLCSVLDAVIVPEAKHVCFALSWGRCTLPGCWGASRGQPWSFNLQALGTWCSVLQLSQGEPRLPDRFAVVSRWSVFSLALLVRPCCQVNCGLLIRDRSFRRLGGLEKHVTDSRAGHCEF